MSTLVLVLFIPLLCVILATESAFAEDNEADEFFAMNIEDLLQIPIVSVSRREEPLKDSPAAIFVLTGEDIRRAGVTSVPEALRLVPGMTVQRVDTNKWAISARGFPGLFTNKLLVLVDGVSVYNPFTTGVFWDLQDLYLEDIERIEVVRGPGGLLWGANAVNGVINIITRSSEKTLGHSGVAGLGNEEEWLFGYRYGTRISPHASARMYVKSITRDSLPVATTDPELSEFIPLADHGWNATSYGFRVDVEDSKYKTDSLTVQLDHTVLNGDTTSIYRGIEEEVPRTLIAPDDMRAGNLRGRIRWEHISSETVSHALQTAFLSESRNEALTELDYDRRTFDVDYSLRVMLTETASLTAGASYRVSRDSLTGTERTGVSASPDTDTLKYVNGFLELKENFTDRLAVSLGAKIFNGPFVSTQIQPNIRTSYKISEEATLWAAFSRAVRVPSRFEAQGSILGNNFVTPVVRAIILTLKSEQVDIESLVAYEAGYRRSFGKDFSLDLAAFYNDYRDVAWYRTDAGISSQTVVLGGTELPTIPMSSFWELQSSTYGGELSLKWNPTDNLELGLGYALLLVDIDVPTFGITERATGATFAGNPEHSGFIRAHYTPFESLQFDAALRLTENSIEPIIKGAEENKLFQIDLRVQYDLSDSLAISLTGINLLKNRLEHEEGTKQALGTKGQSSFIARLHYNFDHQ